MASKTDVTGREKVKVTYLVGTEVVTPVMIGGKMWWSNDSGTVRVKKWETKKVTVIGGKR